MRKSQVVEEWRAEARVETRREDLLALLENRFGPLPEELIQRIQAVSDVQQLKAIFQQALTISSLDQLPL